MQYSRRLTSLASHIVFLFVGFAGAGQILVNWWQNPWVRFGIGPLLMLYLIGGTFLWNRVQTTGRFQRLYYIAMAVLGGGINYIAARVTGSGIPAAIIMLPLIMQGGVLPKQARLYFLAAIVAGLFASMLVGGVPVNEIVTFAAALSGVLAFDFVGRVIVSEEAVHEQLARYAKDVQELSTMRERNRLARDIHDNLGHYLTAISIQAQAADAMLDVDVQQSRDALTHIQNLAHEGLQELRKSITALRTLPMDSRSLHEAIEVLANQSESRELKVDFQVTGAPVPSTAEIEMTIYRVVQEALTNILKHAKATQASIKLSYGEAPRALAVSICDNGMGTVNTDGGFGLLGLRERVRLLGGKFQTRTAPGKGFCIEVEIGL